MLQSNNLLLGDCLCMMEGISDKSVDMILCDLPYNVTGLKWDKQLPIDLLWQHYMRIIKDKGAIVLFGTEPFATRLRAGNLEWYKYDWLWVKNDATDCMNAKNRPMRKVEKIMVFSNGTTANGSLKRMCYYPQGLTACNKQRSGNDYGKTGGSFKQYRASHHPYNQLFTGYPCDVLYFSKDVERYHPTQKPVSLCEYLIKTYTREDELVLDNCAGSGTTAIACINTNRRYLMMEKAADIYGIMCKRISIHKKNET